MKTMVLRSPAVRRLVVAVAVLGMFTYMSSPIDSASAATLPTGVAITGPVPAFAATTGTVSLLGEPDMSNMVAGSSIDLVPLASEAVSGTAFSLSLAMTPTVQSWVAGISGPTGNGLVVVQSGSTTTVESIELPVSTMEAATNTTTSTSGTTPTPSTVTINTFPASWNSAAVATATASAVRSRLQSSGVTKGTINPTPQYSYGGCNAVLLTDGEDSSTIGELHTANVTGMTAKYKYQNTASSSITAGISSSNSGFTGGGSVSVTNSIGTTAATTGTSGTHAYVISDFLYGDFLVSGGYCGNFYVVMPYDAIGDVNQGSNAPSNPWGSCASDPNLGTAVVGSGNTYGTHSQTAQNYGYIASAFGFSFGGSTGYTTSIAITWTNGSSGTTYICGNNGPANSASILYNNPS